LSLIAGESQHVTLRRVARKDQIERGRRLREARLKAGLSQDELADRTGLPRTSFPGWERGTRGIREGTAEKLAAHLAGIEAADLVEVLSPSYLATLRRIEDQLNRITDILESRAT
jgi:transcriptional regulator with XRE-family HTH domain